LKGCNRQHHVTNRVRTLATILASCVALFFPAAARAANAIVPTALVDTFVGTSGTPAGGPIDTFPGADVPFGMVQWSPDTPSENAGGGYEYSDRAITGFSMTHLSGPGCNVFGDFRVLPTVGGIPSDPASAKQPFSHTDEQSAPGWYAVSLGNPAVRTELSVTARTGVARFTFPSTAQANLLFNGASNQAGVTNATFRIDSPTEVSGSASSGFFCGMPDRYNVYFVARFDRPFQRYGTWSGAKTATGSSSAAGPSNGGWVTFDTTMRREVRVKLGLSFVDAGGARANLDAEGGFDVIEARNRATDAWNGMLRRLTVSGGTSAQRRTFYTSLYHVLLHPNVISDVDGRYAGFDGRIHRVQAGRTEYANYSDWDIYRTEVPLLALLAPGETSDMMQSLVDAARQQNGWLPRWALVNGPTSVMGGDSIDPVIAGAYAFGARDFDARAALGAMVKGASTTAPPPGQGWYIPRWELDDQYLRDGYIVNTHTTSVSPEPNGASETLEYALDDFAIARLAYALHDPGTYASFMRRSANWMRLFDSATLSIAPRDADGAFMQTPITENGQSGFQEGNAAQYTWMVPHDLRDLIAAMGGSAAAIAKLDTFFSDLNAGQDKPYAWLGNEPSLGSPWVYLSAGKPWREQEIVRRALTTLYDDTPVGLPGNDDLGTMSAWYVWCALGLYPQDPAVRYLDVGTPLFPSVTLRSPGGPAIQINAPLATTDTAYVNALRVNGAPTTRTWVALPSRGTLKLDVSVSARANTAWGTNAADAPPSYATVPLSLPPAAGATFEPAMLNDSLPSGSGRTIRFAIVNNGRSPVPLTWRTVLSPGLHAAINGARITVTGGARATVDERISADDGLRAGYYNARIDGVAANGAVLEHLALTIRVTNGSQRPTLAYAENRFGNTITPVDLTTHATGPEIRVGEEPRDAALSADGSRLYVANFGGASVSVVDTVAARTIATIKVGSSPNGVALTPDGKTLWVANADDGTIESIDTAMLKPSQTIHAGENPKAIAIAPDGETLYVSNNGSNTVTPVDLRSRTPQTPIPVGERPAGLAISSDGKRLYVANSGSNDVTPVELTGTPHVLVPIRVGVYPMQIAISKDGHTAYVTNYANSTVTPIDLVALRAQPPIEVGGAPYGVAIESDGKMAVVVSHRDNNCVLLDVASGRVSAPISLGNGPYTVAVP
jgi:predicted alpha-1,2-mannosidase